MRVGVPKEIKTDEYRVALTPAGARELIQRGHEVLVETTAGEGSAFSDEQYERAGARIVSVDDAWNDSDLLLKVKEPIEPEYPRLREGLVLFTYLHIAADEPLTRALVDSGIAGVAYETVETDDHRLPLLAPMTTSAWAMVCSTSRLDDISRLTRPERISSRCRIRSIERSRTVTRAPRPSAMIAAL